MSIDYRTFIHTYGQYTMKQWEEKTFVKPIIRGDDMKLSEKWIKENKQIKLSEEKPSAHGELK